MRWVSVYRSHRHALARLARLLLHARVLLVAVGIDLECWLDGCLVDQKQLQGLGGVGVLDAAR